jgi:hypothetical protein
MATFINDGVASNTTKNDVAKTSIKNSIISFSFSYKEDK